MYSLQSALCGALIMTVSLNFAFVDAETLLEKGTPLCKHVSKVLFLPNKGKAKLLKGSAIVKTLIYGYFYTAEGILENAGIYLSFIIVFHSGLVLMRLHFGLHS